MAPRRMLLVTLVLGLAGAFGWASHAAPAVPTKAAAPATSAAPTKAPGSTAATKAAASAAPTKSVPPSRDRPPAPSWPRAPTGPVSEKAARAFLAEVSALLAPVFTVAAEAAWTAATDVTPAHTGARAGAEKAAAALAGSPFVIDRTRAFLQRPRRLSPLTRRQLEKLLLLAAENPGTLPDVVARRLAVEARQTSLLDEFPACLQVDARDRCVRPLSANEVDVGLRTSRDLDLRRKLWEAAMDAGGVLKPGLAELVELRNQVARHMGYGSFFALQTADYGMSPDELLALLDQTLTAIDPLYRGLVCWARHTLAARFGHPAPPKLPVHWLGNRWAQTWPGLAPPPVDREAAFARQSPESLVRAAEAFYVSLGFSPLPETFWSRSDLYPAPATATRRKDAHASAWHIDRQDDVRSLMNVVPGQRWFGTAHHELGHIYYHLAYARPEVPYLLRTGANRAFHEAIGELARLASLQAPYLRGLGMVDAASPPDPMAWLLDAAMDAIVFLPFAAGTLTHFERDLYDGPLPPSAWQERWWAHADRFQGIVPPAPRPQDLCDACTKIQLHAAPARYYDYALATVIKFQLHDHICTKILGQDVRTCNYAGNRAVGAFLRGILAAGATRDWREIMQASTGEPIGPRALVAFFAPLGPELDRRNRGRDCPAAATASLPPPLSPADSRSRPARPSRVKAGAAAR